MDMNEKTRLQDNGDSNTGCTPKTKLERKLAVCMFLVVIIGSSLCITLVAYYRSEFYRSLSKNQTCFTKECIITASSLLKSIDFNQKPCDDFYSFVCGNWIKNSFLIGEQVISQFTRLNTIIALRIKDLLEMEKPGLSEHEKKIKKFYNVCMNRDSKDETAVDDLLEDLKSFGGWPLIEEDWDFSKFDWVDLIGKLYEKGYPYDMLFSIEVDMDIKNTSTSLLVVNQPSLGLNDRAYFLLSKDKVMNNYQSLILTLAFYFQPYLDLSKTRKDIASALMIEKYLAKTMSPKQHELNPDEFYNIMTLSEIEEFAPMISWRKLLNKLLPPNEVIHNNTRLMVVYPDTLKQLNALLVELDNPVGKEFLANYILYRTVVYAAEHLGKDVFTILEDKMHHSAHRDLWQICLTAVVDFFHMSLTATYAESYMDAETKGLLEMMFQDIQETLMEEIKEAKWLDKKTREKALLKVTNARSAIAYREEILDENKLNKYYNSIEVGENHLSNMKAAYIYFSKERMIGLREERIRFRWSDTSNVLTANAFYQPTQNSIIVPIGLLQDAFFAKRRPNYINYGSLGTILGHEYTHAFDSSGSLYDEEGNYMMWWTNSSWDNFQARTKCYVDQYNNYYEPTVKNNVNGTLTLGENIADNGGLLSAYRAYIKTLKHKGYEEKLPGLNFTEKQMFWISFASAWCRKQTNHSLQYTIEYSLHAPSKFRVNGALSNIRAFSDDFNCKEGSKLNPESKCHFWKC